MFARWIDAIVSPHQFDDELALRAQFSIITRQIPTLFVVMLLSAAMVAVVNYGTAPDLLTWGPAGIIALAVVVRMQRWHSNARPSITLAAMRRELRRSYWISYLLVSIISAWAVSLYSYGSLEQRLFIALFMIVAVFGASMCLSVARQTTAVIFIVGGLPITAVLLASNDMLLIAAGVFAIMTFAGGVRLVQHANMRLHELIDAQRNLQLAKARAEEANRTKSEFLSHMNHEIRTPLNEVVGMAELLQETSLDEHQRTFVRSISSSGDRLLTVINDVLEFSKLEAGQVTLNMETFDLRAIIEEVASLVSGRTQPAGVDVLTRYNPGLSQAFVGDGARIRQIVTNLANNAMRFTERGHVMIDVVPFGTGRRAGVKITVRDTGRGIAPEQLANIFEMPSHRGRRPANTSDGQRLGLVVCRHLVELMGGEIGCESILGSGSIFWMTLPLSPAANLDEANALRRYALENWCVLLAAANPLQRSVLGELITEWSGEVIRCGGIEDALDKLLAASKGGKAIDLVIADADLTNADGQNLLQRIRANQALAGLPVLQLCRTSQPPAEPDDTAPLVNIFKPVRTDDLFDGLHRLIAWTNNVPDEPGDVLQEPLQQDNMCPRAKVLVVEDQSVSRMVLTRMLERENYEVLHAANGEEAIRIWAAQRPDIILMDVNMPVMSGYDAAKRIRDAEKENTLPPIPIVGVTAHVQPIDLDRCIDVGMNAYLAKPVHRQALAGVVAHWLMRAPELALAAGQPVNDTRH